MTIWRFWFVATFLLLVPAHLNGQGVSVIEIGNVQLARSLAGVVQDPKGSPMAGVLVEEVSPDWKHSLRSARTDAAGSFSFTPVKGRKIYYLQLRMDGFDPLRVRIKVDRKNGNELKLRMVVSS